MRRLAIQDPSAAGHQPMAPRRPHARLQRRGLQLPRAARASSSARATRSAPGATPRSSSPRSHRWGDGGAARASTACSRWRSSTSAAGARWLARDRFGKKPLFVAPAAARRRLRERAEGDRWRSARDELAIDRAALAEYFRLQYVPVAALDLPRGREAAAGELAWRSTSTRAPSASRRRFWRAARRRTAAPGATPEELLDAVRDAVRRRLVADVPRRRLPLGRHRLEPRGRLHARRCGADVRTFSIGFADPRYDESRYADAVARARSGREHTHRQLEWDDAMALVPSLADALRRAVRRQLGARRRWPSRGSRASDVTVALSGDGGDELFGGYTALPAQPRGPRSPARMPAAAARAARARIAPRGALGRRARLFGELARGRRRAAASTASCVSVWRDGGAGAR